MAKTFEEINAKIASGAAVIVTAEEVLDLVDDMGLEAAAHFVDAVTTATFGPMCSSGAFLNFGHSNPPIRMTHTLLNGVEAYSGIAAVDAYIGATQVAEDRADYGGAHVIYDLVAGRTIELQATSPGTDCYPTKAVRAQLSLSDLNEAYMFNPRNAYQNYNAAVNSSDRPIYTYMGRLKPHYGNINYSTSGQLSPLLNDPYCRTVGIGTRIFLGGAQGYIAWNGTQFNSTAERFDNGIPRSPAATLATIGNLKDMDPRFLQPVIFKNYGISLFVGIGIPIPVLDVDMMRHLAMSDKEIHTQIADYGGPNGSKPILQTVSYAELRSGEVEIAGRKVKTHAITNMERSREIADILKWQMLKGEFYLQKPVEMFSQQASVQKMAGIMK